MLNPSDVNAALASASADLAAGRRDAAANRFRDVLTNHPDHPVALHGLGWILHLTGDHERAVELLQQSLRADPNASACWNNLGIVYAALRRPAEAADAYRRAIALAPDFAGAHLNLGNALRDRRRWPEAVQAYQTAAQLAPDIAAPHHALGTALRETGRPADAVASYRRALDLSIRSNPAAAANVLNDLGLTFARQGNVAEAEKHLRQACSLNPNDPKPRRNLGHLLLQTGRFAGAAEAFAVVAALAPASADPHHDLATALAQAGRLDDAISHFRRAVELRPDHAAAYCNLGVALEEKGDRAGAAAAMARARALRPDSAVIAYHHAALDAHTPPPPACPPPYLVELFDGYAGRFEEHLVEKLHYRGPELLRAAVAASTSRTDLAVLDLGCGTGLCGALFRLVASNLVGVDLSPKMLERARQRGVYDELILADVVDAMRHRQPESTDIILAADVFIYIGDLAPVFAAARSALRPGGLLAFTIEVVPDAAGDYVLRPTRRYAQSAAYIRRLAADAGLDALSATGVVLRAGEEAPVDGMVFVLQSPGR